jgi:osmotically-inducible protein OsmY
VLRRTLWIVDEAINVGVKNGEVRLSGEVETKNDAELIPAFVQSVPGVVSVLSKLRWHNEDGDRSGRLWPSRQP